MFGNNIVVSFQFLILCSFYLHFRVAISLDPQLPDINKLKSCNIDKIYQFGDSLSDTGNHILENPSDQCSKPPYGLSFFENPTGRCSDGLLMIDYIGMYIFFLHFLLCLSFIVIITTLSRTC